MSRHIISFTDIEAMIVLDSLSMLIQNPEKHEVDKAVANRIRYMIFEIVKADKREKPARQYNVCEECMWLDMEDKNSIGYACVNPNKKWHSNTAHRHQKSCKACKAFESRKDKNEPLD